MSENKDMNIFDYAEDHATRAGEMFVVPRLEFIEFKDADDNCTRLKQPINIIQEKYVDELTHHISQMLSSDFNRIRKFYPEMYDYTFKLFTDYTSRTKQAKDYKHDVAIFWQKQRAIIMSRALREMKKEQ